MLDTFHPASWIETELRRRTRYLQHLADLLRSGGIVTEEQLGESEAIGKSLRASLEARLPSRTGRDRMAAIKAVADYIGYQDDIECTIRGRCTPSAPQSAPKAVAKAAPTAAPVTKPKPPSDPLGPVRVALGTRQSALRQVARAIEHGEPVTRDYRLAAKFSREALDLAMDGWITDPLTRQRAAAMVAAMDKQEADLATELAERKRS